MNFFDIILRVVTRAGFTTKPSGDANNLTPTEVDNNFLAIVDEVQGRDIAGAFTTWSEAGTVAVGEVRIYDSKLWLALTSNSATPSEGTDWTQINLGTLGHAQNTDTYLDRFGTNEVTAAEVKQGIRPYTVISGLITQIETDEPTAIILENTTGVTPTFTRIDVGVYAITATGLFEADKVWCMIADPDANIERNSDNQVRIFTTDDTLFKRSFEIRIYP